MPNEKPELSLTDVHRDAITAANSSWSQTDTAYVTVCSALIALTAIFGWDDKKPKIQMAIVGVLLLLLALNWMWLIKTYRREILCSLKVLSEAKSDPGIGVHFNKKRQRFESLCEQCSQYFIAIVVLLASLIMIFFPIYNTIQPSLR
jgi:hypothetical protein